MYSIGGCTKLPWSRVTLHQSHAKTLFRKGSGHETNSASTKNSLPKLNGMGGAGSACATTNMGFTLFTDSEGKSHTINT